ncbi:MAG: hypothetical protein LQ349_007716 [Xanthoria aureola]|nr:MAG: hypothetical protein LQ349_007716 [Xanthoria aureola]
MVVMLPKLINRPAEMLVNARNENDVNSISRFEQATSVPIAAAHLCQYTPHQPTVKLLLSRQDWTRTDLESSSMKDFIVHRERRAVNDLSDRQVRQYLRKFYYVSNDISLEKEWGELFAEDGVYIMGNRKATGPEGTAPPFLPILFSVLVYFLFLTPHPLLHCYSPHSHPWSTSPPTYLADSPSTAIRKLRKKLYEETPQRDHSPHEDLQPRQPP